MLSPGRISLKVRTSVSEPTTEGSVPLSGRRPAVQRPANIAVDPQAPRRHHDRTAVRRLDDDRRPRARRRPPGDQRLPRACPRSRCSARCSAAGTSSATRPNSSSSSRRIWRGRWRATSWPSRTTISTRRATAPACSSVASTASTEPCRPTSRQRPLSRRRRLHLQMIGDRAHGQDCVEDKPACPRSVARRGLVARSTAFLAAVAVGAAGRLRHNATASRSARFPTTTAPTIRS